MGENAALICHGASLRAHARSMLQAEPQRGPKILTLRLQAVEPDPLLKALNFHFGLFGQRQEESKMPPPNSLLLTAPSQPLRRILPRRLQQPITRFSLMLLIVHQ